MPKPDYKDQGIEIEKLWGGWSQAVYKLCLELGYCTQVVIFGLVGWINMVVVQVLYQVYKQGLTHTYSPFLSLLGRSLSTASTGLITVTTNINTL